MVGPSGLRQLRCPRRGLCGTAPRPVFWRIPPDLVFANAWHWETETMCNNNSFQTKQLFTAPVKCNRRFSVSFSRVRKAPPLREGAEWFSWERTRVRASVTVCTLIRRHESQSVPHADSNCTGNNSSSQPAKGAGRVFLLPISIQSTAFFFFFLSWWLLG